MVSLHPRMMMQDAAGIEELDASEFAAHFEQETETDIDVVVGFRQTRAEHDDPAFDRRRDKKFFVAREAFDPGAGLDMVKAEGGLNGFKVPALDREP